MVFFRRIGAALLVNYLCLHSCFAQHIFINGKVLGDQGRFAQAFVTQGDRFIYVGSNEGALGYKNAKSELTDLNGKTVIPGLIDSHIHAIRAGLHFKHEMSLEGTKSIKEALQKIHREARQLLPNQWIIIAGGWSELQFKEKRKFTQHELQSVARGHPFYVQLNYSSVLLSPDALVRLQLKNRLELLSSLTVETLDNGKASGWLSGSSRAISQLFDLLPQPTFLEQKKSSLVFFDELIKLGLTGVIDPGGYNLNLDAYRPIYEINQEKRLKLRVRFHICAPKSATELDDFKQIVQRPELTPNTPFLRFNGIGENVTWSMYNNETPSDEQKSQLKDVLSWANKQSLSVTLHWNNDPSVHHLIEVLQKVDSEQSIRSLRWSIAHLTDASDLSINAMSQLGVGWLVQDGFFFTGSRFVKQHGLTHAQSVPKLNYARDKGVTIGAGTDAHRVMSYNPFRSLQWLLDGKTVEGLELGDPTERPTRLEAIDLYTKGSAWFSFEELERGQIKPGFLADAVVLDHDFFSIPLNEISSIRPLMTLIGGKIAYKRGLYK